MNKTDERFVATVWRHYDTFGRHDLPWRIDTSPYAVLVSELMLQQTQVDRVVPKYLAFMAKFPTLEALAKAPLSAVIVSWQGLGYNRRAKYLHDCAKAIVTDHAGVWPDTVESLRALPGVGPYTASALLNFAFLKPVPLIETNVRTVYLHHYFKTATAVPDSELWPIITRTLSTDWPRQWHYALMDYGSHLKRTVGNPSRRSRHHTTQSRFVGSRRQVRGAILDVARQKGKLSAVKIKNELSHLKQASREVILEELQSLKNEGLLTKTGHYWQLPS